MKMNTLPHIGEKLAFAGLPRALRSADLLFANDLE